MGKHKLMSKFKRIKKPGRTYHISFNTSEMPGLIKAVAVTLNNDIIRDDKTLFNIALCDDPLYPDLVRYVKANPPPRKE